MKSKLFLTAIAVCLSLAGFAQTKGTNALSFGINSSTQNLNNSGDETKYKHNYFSLGYGNFINDNTKIGMELNYGTTIHRQSSFYYDQKVKSYGGNLSYQKYFPIIKKLYAYAGGRGAYSYSKETDSYVSEIRNFNTNEYSIGAYGGITWFLSKRFAFETNLLSANAYYSETKGMEDYSGTKQQSKSTSFNLTSDGFINNLGFKIYLLF